MVPGSSGLLFERVMFLLLCSVVLAPESRPATYPASKEPQTSKKDQKAEKTENAETTKRPPPKSQVVPAGRLNLKYRILKRASDGQAEETNPDSTFLQDDRIQIRVRANRPGYLYIIQSEGSKDGELIFPHSGIGGQNLLTGTKEHQIPGLDCDKKYKDDHGGCWLPISSATGRVWITVYFSPSPTDRPFTIQSGGKVSHQEIVSIRHSAATAEGSGKYGRQVTAARNSNAVAAKLDLNNEPSPIAEPDPSIRSGSNSTSSDPTGPDSTDSTPPTPAVKPEPSALWGKLEAEFDGALANGLRVNLLRVTETGRVSASPLDSFKTGDKLNLDFYGNFDAFVYVLHVSPLGRTTVVFPDTRNTKKIKANYRSVASMKRLSLNLNEKGVHTLQVVFSASRVNVFEEAIEKSGQLNPVSAAGQQSREAGFDCVSSLNLFQAPRRAVSLASDASSNQGGAIAVVLSAQAGISADLCGNLTVEQFKGDKIKGQEGAVFEIRFKQV